MIDWRHIILFVLILAGGYWLGSKYPGMLSKVTGGAVSA